MSNQKKAATAPAVAVSAGNGNLFITSRQNIVIVADDGKTKFEIPNGYIGSVPKWVQSHWYFKAHCTAGNITSIVSTKDDDLEAAELKAAAEKEAAEKVAELKRKVDEAVEAARIAAEQEAAEKGFDVAQTAELKAAAEKEAEQTVLAANAE
ncbi:MAG: hypothetical protein LBN00_06295 [Oscillospiraceae bacterium]|jgi:hypothetical protein|nr:hypothetical protein [Oscillospiraceae bacterium]